MSSRTIPKWLSEYDNDVVEGIYGNDFRCCSVLHLALVTPVSVPSAYPKLQDFIQKWNEILDKYYALEDPSQLGPVYASLNEEKNKLRIVDCERALGGEETLYDETLTFEEFAECARLFLMSRRV